MKAGEVGSIRYESARLTGFSAPSDREERGQMDLNFLLLVLLLLGMGVVMVLSSSYARAYYDPGRITGGNAAYYFIRQLIFAALGVALMLMASRVPMAVYHRGAFPSAKRQKPAQQKRQRERRGGTDYRRYRALMFVPEKKPRADI